MSLAACAASAQRPQSPWSNVASLGGTPLLIGVIGVDNTADRLKALLTKNGCRTDLLVEEHTRLTTRKLRVLAGQHHLVRVDYERKRYLSAETECLLLDRFTSLLGSCDGVIVQDYAKGVLSRQVIQAIIRETHNSAKFVCVDPHRTTPLSHYEGADYVTPNLEESMALAQINPDSLNTSHTSTDHLSFVGQTLLEKLQARSVVVTRGKDGMSAFSKDGPSGGLHIPTFARSVFDVTGAGDTVIATFALGIASGFSLAEACLVFNCAARIVVGKIGCASPTIDELKSFMEDSGHQSF
jgi:D-glycero-beta-D-manno-heptose-7-phosphate kinase